MGAATTKALLTTLARDLAHDAAANSVRVAVLVGLKYLLAQNGSAPVVAALKTLLEGDGSGGASRFDKFASAIDVGAKALSATGTASGWASSAVVEPEAGADGLRSLSLHS